MTKRSPVAERFGRRLRRRPELEAQALGQDRARPPVEVWASRDWLVQVFADPAGERITVNRTTLAPRGARWADGITWDELQAIKREIGRADRWALEVYPADDDVIDVANMRHLFLVDGPPAFAWRRGCDIPAEDIPADVTPGSGSHAPDPEPIAPREAAENLDLDDIVWVRSTGRGTHDVMAASSPVPVVLASVMFTEGVKGRTLALERFAAALGSVVQDVVR